MNYRELLINSEKDLSNNIIAPIPIINIFQEGAKWMHFRLNNRHVEFNNSINYTSYGLMKYGLSMFFFLVSIYYLLKVNVLLLPFCIFVFYLVEIHFLFLFPLLIDSAERPIFTGVKFLYSHGIIRTLLKVIPIGFYMLSGLAQMKDPLKKWYIGCNAILIWYKDEVRNRI